MPERHIDRKPEIGEKIVIRAQGCMPETRAKVIDPILAGEHNLSPNIIAFIKPDGKTDLIIWKFHDKLNDFIFFEE